MTPLPAVWSAPFSFLEWRLDGLSLMFLIPTLVVSAAAALYAPRYLAQERYREESGLRFGLFFALFVAGMTGTLLAGNLILFLVCWEVMTLASYVLVAHETRERECVRAAFKYFFMTHVGSACLLLALLLLHDAGGSWSFDGLTATFASLAENQPVRLHVILALLFLGFATKAGLYPFGDWLPDAHPAAPAPVSAVLSGAMIKLGLYGFLRFFVAGLAAASPGDAVVWGGIIAGFGLLSALAGGFAASAANDIKVLLAYSSIAQSGLIALGLGVSMALAPVNPALASLALLGASFHVVADAVVKALLFLNAGALQWRTGSRRLIDLGGLFTAMPVTGWTALVASLAIAGFPPLTAFTAKWLMLQATVLSGVPAVSVAGLALLVASLFSILYSVKFFAASFANRPMRSGRLEVPATMWAAEAALGLLVVAISLAPGPVLLGIARLLADLPTLASSSVPGGSLIAVRPLTGAFSPAPLIFLGVWVFVLARTALGSGPDTVRREVWTGGVIGGGGGPTPHPLGFYSPLREAMRRAYPRLRWPFTWRPSWVPHAVDPDRWVYHPTLNVGRRMGHVLRRAHTGLPQVYLAWQVAGAAGLVILLFVLLHR
jgi:hydrogenase-4 component B